MRCRPSRSGGVDLVLSGLNMPEMDAVELIEYLRRKEPFGVITAESAPSVRQRALAAGTSFFLTEQVPADAASGWPPAQAGRDGGSPTPVAQGCRPTVASVLEELVRRRVRVAEVDESPRREMACTFARYVDADGHDVAVCIAEIAFAAATTAALSMASPRSAAEWAEAGVLTEAMAQNFYEVANVLTSVVNPGRGRCMLVEVLQLADSERPPDHEQLAASPRVNLEVTVEGYGTGRIAIIALERGAHRPRRRGAMALTDHRPAPL